MSYADYLKSPLAVSERLAPELGAGTIMFNVPNPESDVDETKSLEDSRGFFSKEVAKLRSAN